MHYICMFIHIHTVNIFRLYIFSLNSHFSNIRENMYNAKITFIITESGYPENVNFSTRKFFIFLKFAKDVY